MPEDIKYLVPVYRCTLCVKYGISWRYQAKQNSLLSAVYLAGFATSTGYWLCSLYTVFPKPHLEECLKEWLFLYNLLFALAKIESGSIHSFPRATSWPQRSFFRGETGSAETNRRADPLLSSENPTFLRCLG